MRRKSLINIFDYPQGSKEDFEAIAAEERSKIQRESLDLVQPITPAEYIAWRKRLGFTSADFARVTGHLVSRETFTRLELGDTLSAKTSGLVRMCLAERLPKFQWVEKANSGRRRKRKILKYEGDAHGDFVD